MFRASPSCRCAIAPWARCEDAVLAARAFSAESAQVKQIRLMLSPSSTVVSIGRVLLLSSLLLASPMVSSGNPDVSVPGSVLPSAPPGASSARYLALALAGADHRHRLVALAVEMDPLLLRETAAWSALTRTLPTDTGSDAARSAETQGEIERLQLLSAMREEYAERERLLESRLSQSAPETGTLASQETHRTALELIAVQDWHDLALDVQRAACRRLDAMRESLVAHALKSGWTPDRVAMAELESAGVARLQAEDRLNDMRLRWQDARVAAGLRVAADRLDFAERALASARDQFEQAAELERLARSTAGSPSHVLVLNDLAGALLRSGVSLALTASGSTEERLMLRASPLLRVEGGERQARAIVDLTAAYNREVDGLLASLAIHAHELIPLRAMHDRLQAVLSEGAGKTDVSNDPVRELLAAADELWVELSTLQQAGRDFRPAAHSPQQAASALLFGAQMERLVRIEALLTEAALAHSIDPAFGRSMTSATRQQHIASRLRLRAEFLEWLQGWEQRIAGDAGRKKNLQAWMQRAQALMTGQMQRFIDMADKTKADEPFAASVGVLGHEAEWNLERFRQIQSLVRQVREAVAHDLMLGAKYGDGSDVPWTWLALYFDHPREMLERVEVLLGSEQSVRVLGDTTLPPTRRVHALMRLSQALGVGWVGTRVADRMHLSARVADSTVVLSNIESETSIALELRRDRSVALPLRVAQSSLSPSSMRQMAAVPLELTATAWEEIESNWKIYGGIFVVSSCAGAACGTIAGPGGTVAGLSAGAIVGGLAVGESLVVDTSVGQVRRTANKVVDYQRQAGRLTPKEADAWKRSVTDTANLVKGTLALSNLLKGAGTAAFRAVRGGYRNLEVLLSGQTRRGIEQAEGFINVARNLAQNRETLKHLTEVEFRGGMVSGAQLGSLVRQISKLEPELERLRGLLNARGIADAEKFIKELRSADRWRGLAGYLGGAVDDVNNLLTAYPILRTLLAAHDSAVQTPADKSVPPTRVSGAPPSQATTTVQAPVPPTGAATCPPGQMVGPKGVCATEKDVLSGYKSWSDEFNTDKPPAKPPVQEAGTETQGEKAPPVVEPQPAKQDEGDGMSGGFSGVESGGGTSPGTSVEDAARAFGERERRRSTDVGGRGLISGLGGTGGSKFGSDSIKRETQKVYGGGTGASTGEPAQQDGTSEDVGSASSVKETGPSTQKSGDPYKSGGTGTSGEKQTTTAWTRPAHWPKPLPLPVADSKRLQPYIVETVSEWLDGRSGRHCIVAYYNQQSFSGSELAARQGERVAQERSFASSIPGGDKPLLEIKYPGLKGMLSDMRALNVFVNLRPDPSYGKNTPKDFGECR